MDWEDISNTRDNVSSAICKHLVFCQKYSAGQRILNSLSVFWYPEETLSLVFDILHVDFFKTDFLIEFFLLYPACYSICFPKKSSHWGVVLI